MLTILLFFTGPEEACHVLLVGLDHSVLFHLFELAEEFVRQEGAKIGEWQMYRFWDVCRALHGLIDATAGGVCCLLQVAHVYVLSVRKLILLARILSDWALVGDELRLVDAL